MFNLLAAAGFTAVGDSVGNGGMAGMGVFGGARGVIISSTSSCSASGKPWGGKYMALFRTSVLPPC